MNRWPVLAVLLLALCAAAQAQQASPDATVPVYCPGCKYGFYAPAAQIGQEIKCPKCRAACRVPRPDDTSGMKLVKKDDAQEKGVRIARGSPAQDSGERFVENLMRNPGEILKNRFNYQVVRDKDGTYRVVTKDASLPEDAAQIAAKCQWCGKPLYLHEEGFPCTLIVRYDVIKERRNVKCPCCGLEREMIGAWNQRPIGMNVDSDFCPHLTGGRTMSFEVHMCPGCGYAAYATDFEKRTVPEALKRKVLETLKPRTTDALKHRVSAFKPGSPLSDFTAIPPEDIPSYLKYWNAVWIYTQEPYNPTVHADLYFKLSHAYRQDICRPMGIMEMIPYVLRVQGALADYGQMEAGENVMDKVRAYSELLAKRPNLLPHQRTFIYLEVGAYLDRFGDFAGAREALRAALREAPQCGFPPVTTQQLPYGEKLMETRDRLIQLVQQRLIFLEEERQAQEIALTNIVRTLELLKVSQGVATSAYLAGELSRRLDKYADAYVWFDLAVQFPGARPLEKDFALKQLALPKVHEARAQARESKALPFVQKIAHMNGVTLNLPQADEAAPARPAVGNEKPPAQGPAQAGPAPVQACAACMNKFWLALCAFRNKNQDFPNSVEDLYKAGLLKAEDVNGMVCPNCKKAYQYLKPRSAQSADPLLMHENLGACPNNLFKDGGIKPLVE